MAIFENFQTLPREFMSKRFESVKYGIHLHIFHVDVQITKEFQYCPNDHILKFSNFTTRVYVKRFERLYEWINLINISGGCDLPPL